MDKRQGADATGDDDRVVVLAPVPDRTDPPCGDDGESGSLDVLLELLRSASRRVCAAQAEQLRLVALFVAAVETEGRAMLDRAARVPGQPPDHDVLDAAVTGEVMAVLGLGRGQAGVLASLATRLADVLPETLAALSVGHVDLARVRVLVAATEVLDDGAAREVQRRVLQGVGQGPWAGPSPRTWRSRVERAVTGVDPRAAQLRRQRALADRAVRAWGLGDGTGVLQIRAADTDILLADEAITDLAASRPAVDDHGCPLTMDQRRADAVIAVFRSLRDGADLPRLPWRRERVMGLVLHSDTLFGDGLAAQDPGQLHSLGAPASVDPRTAGELARDELAQGSAVRVLVTDRHGNLQRMVRLGPAPGTGWTRPALTAAVAAQLPALPPLHTDRYAPTAAITQHVHARNPHCTAYDCDRSAHRCDLDHNDPWPRGPTTADNLQPRCRRHHELKTRRLVDTRLQADGTVVTRMLTGRLVTTRPEPLPGHGPGEGYRVAA
ncbi:MAG: DUF222 domain-containing protein [Actinomycetes bacterium]